jgi:hypothetical protein
MELEGNGLQILGELGAEVYKKKKYSFWRAKSGREILFLHVLSIND